MAFFGRNSFLLFRRIGAVEWLTMARIVRGPDHGAEEDGIHRSRPVARLQQSAASFSGHMIPNVLGPIIVYTTLTIPAVMLLEAFLSFLASACKPPMSRGAR